MAKKKPRPNGNRPHRRPAPPPTNPPDRRVMEGMIQQLTAQVQGHAADQTPSGQAQATMYRAFAERDEMRRVQLAQDALGIDPDCADAYVLLAEHTRGRKRRLELYEKGVAAGERSLGAEAFRRNAGHFWGVVETRPYMRARLGFAVNLWEISRRDEAVRHLQELLRLNPNDNQGIRYNLAGYLLFLDQDEELARLLGGFDEDSAAWAYTRALLTFRREGDTIDARRLLKTARKSNAFVPDYITGNKVPSGGHPDHYSPGAESEALVYVEHCLGGWKGTAGAVAWLRANAKPKKKSETPEPRGPLGFVKKWLTTHLPLEGAVWQADSRRMPNWLRIGGEFMRPWTILVTDPTHDYILAHEMPEALPSPAHLWDTVMKAMQHPAAGTPQRPTEIQVPPGEPWESLAPHFEQVGVRLVTDADLTALDEVFVGLYEHVGGPPEPGLLDIVGVTPALAGAFYDAAATFFRRTPWKKVGHEAAIRVECDKIPGGPWFAVLMGQAGMTTGLALYDDLDTLQKMWADPGDGEFARRVASTALIFGEEWAIPVADCEAAKRLGWPVAREDAYPEVIHKDLGSSMRQPLAGELELMEACLRAIPDFVERRRQDDATREEITIPSAAGPVTLSWVPEQEG